MKIEEVRKLEVLYNGEVVGYLAQTNDGKIAFQYEEEWVSNGGFSISPLSLPLSNKIYSDGKSLFDGLYGVFWDSLPDGWGELLVRRMLASRGISFERLSPLQRLSIIERNGLGGLEYRPNKQLIKSSYDFTLDELALEAEKILGDEKEDINLDKIYQLGASSGGARPKAHIVIDNEEWIVKFPCKADPNNIGEKEYQANMLAQKCGINTCECRLFESKLCSGYFGSKRFDRNGGKKVHMISLAALLETSHRLFNLDYNHLFKVISIISADKTADMYEAFRRMCFNVLFGNKDDHSKNFSFLYIEGVGYQLSPAYDLTSTPLLAEHSMSVNGKGKPSEDDLLEVARLNKLNLQKCKDILANIKQVINQKS